MNVSDEHFDPIPPPVRDWLRRTITSASQLEVLLVLARAKRWSSIEDLAARMVLTDDHIVELVTGLRDAGLVTLNDGSCRFEPDDAQAAAVVSELAALYDTFRLRILNIVYDVVD